MSEQKKKKKIKDKIVITFVGGSTKDVTGSCVLISYPKHNGHGLICLEAGMIQGNPKPELEYAENKQMISKIPVKDIEAVFITHPHVDHTGNLPIFNSDKGFQGNIICSKQSVCLLEDLLKDSVYLHERLIESLKSSKGKKYKPLYNSVNMYNMFTNIMGVETHEKHKLNDYVSFQFFNSGHVIGGTQIKFWFTLPNGRVRTIVYTGDLGSEFNRKEQPFIKTKDIIPSANLYIFEGTYGIESKCFAKKQVTEERKLLKQKIESTIKNGGRVFFPSFSYGRTQTLMAMCYEWFKDEEWFKNIPIVIEGKLTNAICNTYSRILDIEDKKYWQEISQWKNFKYNRDYSATKIALTNKISGIYIASSGFIQPKTRSYDYIKSCMGREQDLVVFVGFFGGEGSIGQRLIEAEKGAPVKLDNKMTLIKKCQILSLHSFSSHIQQSEIINYWKNINAERILVHHASSEAKKELVKKGTEELRKNNKTTQVIAVDNGSYQFVL